ncbi:MAG: hypothetical protein WBN04_14125, partial [Paracoccaceae bacterium]
FGYLFDLAIAGNSGAMVAYRDKLNEGGYQIGDDAFSIDETLPPGTQAAEYAMNLLLRRRFEETDANIGDLFKMAHGIDVAVGSALSCDEVWCYDMTGTVRARFSVRARPSCDPVVDRQTNCAFPVRFIVSAQIESQMPYGGDGVVDLLNDIIRADRILAGDQTVLAEFHRTDRRWEIDSMKIQE